MAGETVEVTVSFLDREGTAVGALPEGQIKVKGALPGELVKARITFSGKREIHGETQRILRHSPDRLTSPPCDKGASCDGCPLIAMKYSAQLAWKQSLVKREMEQYPSLQAVPVQDIIPSPLQLGYRNSAKLVVAGKFTHPVVGIYKRNSHDVLDISDCPLHHPLINRVASAVKEGIRKGKVPVYSPRSGSGLLRYLVVRVSEAEQRAMVTFVTVQRSFNEIHHLAKFIQAAVPEVDVVLQNVNSSGGNVILGEKDHFITQKKDLPERLGHIRFAVSPRSFFQVNGGGARIIYEKVREWAGLSGKETVLDLYCGIGGISLFLAGKAKEVIGIESVEQAVVDAGRNARLNRLGNCSFHAGDAAEILEDLGNEGLKADLVVLNPPRKGCDRKVLKQVAQLGPARLIYVSCSPESLARDLDLLAHSGYVPKKIQPVDMFPQTPHVENIALLEKNPTKVN